MTLVRSEDAALFASDVPPQGAAATAEEYGRWAQRMFDRLDNFLRRPEFPGVVFTRLDSILLPEFKAEDGMMVYAGPGTLGAQEGFYVRESGAWKKIAGT